MDYEGSEDSISNEEEEDNEEDDPICPTIRVEKKTQESLEILVKSSNQAI